MLKNTWPEDLTAYQLILVCCYSNKVRLWKRECFHLLRLEIDYRSCVVTFANYVHSRLILVHGI